MTRPATLPGILLVVGTYNQLVTGSLHVEVVGPFLGDEYDRLAVNGLANFDGLLSVGVIGDCVPQSTDAFTVLTAIRIDGMFSHVVGTRSRFPANGLLM